MTPGKHLRWLFLCSVLIGLGCSAPKPIEGVVRPNPGEPPLEIIPGPMPGFGSFDTFSDALMAACPLILSKPNATAGRLGDQDFQLRWRNASEYCAWLYYTPEHKYEMSMLTDQHKPDDLDRKKSCVLPSHVEDPRYPSDSLKYIFALHNHPYGGTLSKYDIQFIVSEGARHGFESPTKHGIERLSIIAFFSNSATNPSCDGFHQYIPATHQILKWTREQDGWQCEQTGLVVWYSNGDEFSVNKTSSSCFAQESP
jgi:hypothetical protein